MPHDGTVLPLPDSYDVSLSAVEADSSGETEAGTTQRDVVRQGVVNISVSFSVTAKWLKALTAYSKKDKLPVDYFDTETADMKNTEMYIVDCFFYFERILGRRCLNVPGK